MLLRRRGRRPRGHRAARRRAAVGEIFNVGSEEEVSIPELAERIIEGDRIVVDVRFIPYDEVYGDQYEDMLRRVPDTTKIRGRFGWSRSTI